MSDSPTCAKHGNKFAHLNAWAFWGTIRRQRGFILAEQLPAVIHLDRLCLLMVRCGSCRFLAPANQVQTLIDIIEAEGSTHVRDISLPAGSSYA